ncbi:MAG: hypothetical protein KGQ37_08200 [Hyphomicrobiales bacterium]|nr:hypothetical protein [Hyphomicrobiales bacterium]
MLARHYLYRPALVAAAWLAWGACLQPAMAADDGSGSILSGLMGIAGVDKKPAPDIFYRERPPLVVPPRYNLPKPQARISRTDPAWPKDPDAIARRQARHANKFSFIPVFHDQGRLLTQQQLLAHRLAPGTAPAVAPDPCNGSYRSRECELLTPQQLAAFKPAKPADVLTPGVEPARRSLTDPPPGYRIPTHAVKETRMAPKDSDQSQFAFTRDQAKH